MTTEDEIKVTSELAVLIIKLLEEKLADNKRRAYPMPDIYHDLKNEIKQVYPDTDRYKFQKALSTATKNGMIKGYEIKLGKNGGLGRIDYKKPGTPDTNPVIVTVNVPVPAEKEFSTLEFNGKNYRVAFSKESLEKLLTKVFCVRESADGTLLFDDRSFATEHSEITECLDNFLFYFNESEVASNEV